MRGQPRPHGTDHPLPPPRKIRRNEKKLLTIFYPAEIIAELSGNAAIAQQAERILGTDEVSSSNLDSSSIERKPLESLRFRWFFVCIDSCNCRAPAHDRISPSRLRRATARVAAPSVCFAVARILLAAAPTAPPCFRRWRRSSPLLLTRGGFGMSAKFPLNE